MYVVSNVGCASSVCTVRYTRAYARLNFGQQLYKHVSADRALYTAIVSAGCMAGSHSRMHINITLAADVLAVKVAV